MAIRRTIAEFSDDIATADIADDAITGGKLANDIAISTTGNIATTGSGTLAVAGASTLTGNVTAAGTLAVTGTSTLTGNATASGNLTVSGNFTSVGIDDNAVGAVAITIDPDEKVSIGTTSTSVGGAPNSTDGKLNIFTNAGGDSWAQQIRHDHASGHGLFCRAGGSSSSHYSALFTAGDESVIGLAILGNGKVGIGTTSPEAKLHVKTTSGGDYRLNANDSGTDIWVGTGEFIRWIVANGNTEVLRCKADGTLSGASSADISDERLKENIDTVSGALEKINQLDGRTFTWKTMAKMPAGVQYGMIAQEVEEILPELVLQDESIRVLDKDGDVKPSNEEFLETDEYCKEVQTRGLIPILIEAVKELSAKVTALENA